MNFNIGDRCLALREDGSYSPAKIDAIDEQNQLCRVIINDEENREILEKVVSFNEIRPIGDLALKKKNNFSM
jgi:hypothetical protein